MGIRVGSRHLTEEQALDTLRHHSQRNNTELREVARLIREHGALPSPHVKAGVASSAPGPNRTPHTLFASCDEPMTLRPTGAPATSSRRSVESTARYCAPRVLRCGWEAPRRGYRRPDG
ncbi:ANTAR domain-containing protein [Streptomyces adustus]